MGSIKSYCTKGNGSQTKVLVIGGSYGGLAAGLNLLDLCHGKSPRFTPDAEGALVEVKPKFPVQIKFVDERDGYYHLIGSPLALASDEFAPKAWVRFADLPALKAPGLSWAQGSAVKVDCERKVATIKDGNTGKEYEEAYDYLIAASGLRRTWPVVPQSLTRDEYLEEAGAHIQACKNAKEGVVIIGGGAVGIEMAAELKLVQPDQQVTLIHSRDTLLSSEPLSDEFKTKSCEILQGTGVKVILGLRVLETKSLEAEKGFPSFDLTLSNGSHVKAGHVIFAISHSVPTTNYLPTEALDKDGYVKINSSLNFPATLSNHLSHFAIGDLVSWSGIKRCGGAMHMGFHAASNIYQQLLQVFSSREAKFLEYPEVPPMMALAVGKQAVCFSPPNEVTFGEDVAKVFFGEDIGFSICWNYMKLGVDGTDYAEPAAKEKVAEFEVDVKLIETTSKLEAIAV